MVNLTKLENIIPARVIKELSLIPQADSILKVSHFVSQCSHESANFKKTAENLNYGSDALARLFPSDFTPKQALSYHRDPVRIANRLYANRLGNGDEASGDGNKYKGHGYIQLTGKSNHTLFSKYIGVDCITNPELISKQYPLTSAAWFFDVNGIWKLCEKGSSDQCITKVTRVINGGTIGIDDRIKQFHAIFNALSG
jgi:putative chitinase